MRLDRTAIVAGVLGGVVLANRRDDASSFRMALPLWALHGRNRQR